MKTKIIYIWGKDNAKQGRQIIRFLWLVIKHKITKSGGCPSVVIRPDNRTAMGLLVPAHAHYKSLSRLDNIAAFTLVEISVVLVIIGLLVGGVLVGKDLIHSAELRSQIKQFEEYQLAYNTFKMKYNCIVGDCYNATQFFGTADSFGNTVNNGDGNGVIDTLTKIYYDNGINNWTTSTEMWGSFQQLYAAKLISFAPKNTLSRIIGVSHPTAKLNENSSFFFGASYNFTNPGRNPHIDSYTKGTNSLWFAHCNPANNNVIGLWDDYCAVFTASDLKKIDEKLDDGMPLTGKLLGFGGYSTNNDCLAGSGVTSTYKIINTTSQCQAAFVVE